MSHATLRARKGTIAALTLFATIAFGTTLATVDSASASVGVPVSGPILTPLPSPTPTDSAAPTPSPTTTQTTKTTTQTTKTTAKPKHARLLTARERIMRAHEKKVRKVLREAAKQKGKPYVYGADGPHAFDCSGLVRYVFLHALDRHLPHNAAAQYAQLPHVSESDLEPGDLVFYDDLNHVGMYIGGGEIIGGPQSGTDVQIGTLSGGGADVRGAGVLG